jgi:hypothetical protein
MSLMSSIEMKEIRIPSALFRERRPSAAFVFLKATFAAVLVAVISFFFLNACAIAILGIVAAIRRHTLDFSIAYRYFAAPSAAGIFLVAWVGALIFFFRERNL